MTATSRPLMLALGLIRPDSGAEAQDEEPWNGPSLFEQMGITKGPVFLLYQDDYLIYAFESLAAAIENGSNWAMTYADSDEDRHSHFVIDKAEEVPAPMYQHLLDHGTGQQHYSDGYVAASKVSPFVTEHNLWEHEEDEEEDGSWKGEEERVADKTPRATLPAGMLLYHGTSTEDRWEQDEAPDPPTWFSNSYETAVWFASWHGGPNPRVLTYQATRDLSDLFDFDSDGFDAWREAVFDDDIDGLAEATCKHATGWVIRNNYPEHGGDDIMLCDTGSLVLVDVDDVSEVSR